MALPRTPTYSANHNHKDSIVQSSEFDRSEERKGFLVIGLVVTGCTTILTIGVVSLILAGNPTIPRLAARLQTGFRASQLWSGAATDAQQPDLLEPDCGGGGGGGGGDEGGVLLPARPRPLHQVLSVWAVGGHKSPPFLQCLYCTVQFLCADMGRRLQEGGI